MHCGDCEREEGGRVRRFGAEAESGLAQKIQRYEGAIINTDKMIKNGFE